MSNEAKWWIATILLDAKELLIQAAGPYLIIDKMLRGYYREWDQGGVKCK